MTLPADDWKPILFKRYLERTHRDEKQVAARAAEASSPRSGRVLAATEMILE